MIAVRLLGLADALASTVGGRLLPFDADQFAVTRQSLRLKVDPREWDDAWQAGGVMAIDDALLMAQSVE